MLFSWQGDTAPLAPWFTQHTALRAVSSQQQLLRLVQTNPTPRSKCPRVHWLGEAVKHAAMSLVDLPEKGSSALGRNNHSLSKQLPSEWTYCEMLVTEYEAAGIRTVPHTRRYHLCHTDREKEFPSSNGSSHQRPLLSGCYSESGGITIWVSRTASKNCVDW